MSRGKQKRGGRKTPPKKQAQKRAPPKMVIRNAAPAAMAMRPAAGQVRNAARGRSSPPRLAMTTRVHEMGGSHVVAGIGGGAIGTALGVVAVGKQWVGPKTAAGVLIGTGAATTAAGWYWDADHVMAVGAGLTAAGTVSMVNQLAVAAYEAAEKKAAEKKAKREQEEKAKQFAEEEAAKRQRNAPRIVLVARSDIDPDSDHGQGEGYRAYAEEAA